MYSFSNFYSVSWIRKFVFVFAHEKSYDMSEFTIVFLILTDQRLDLKWLIFFHFPFRNWLLPEEEGRRVHPLRNRSKLSRLHHQLSAVWVHEPVSVGVFCGPTDTDDDRQVAGVSNRGQKDSVAEPRGQQQEVHSGQRKGTQDQGGYSIPLLFFKVHVLGGFFSGFWLNSSS